jgi:hypothetical protein
MIVESVMAEKMFMRYVATVITAMAVPYLTYIPGSAAERRVLRPH